MLIFHFKLSIILFNNCFTVYKIYLFTTVSNAVADAFLELDLKIMVYPAKERIIVKKSESWNIAVLVGDCQNR